MFRTPKVGTRALASIATIATLTGVTLPLMATAASASVSSVTASPATYQQASPSTVNVTANVVRTAGDATPIRYAIVSGPDADKGGNGTLVADGDCTGATTPVTCSYANTVAGTDVVRVFADTNGNLVIDAGEPTSDATVTLYGPPAAVDLKPDSDSAAAGTCNAFTATVTDAGGRARPSQPVKLEATMTGTVTGRTLTYCDPGTTNPTSTNAGGASVSGVSTPANGTVTTDSTGKATFGIRSDQPGTASVRAYVDTNLSGTFDAGEPSDVSTKTFTAGGAAGNSAQDAVASLAVSPTSQSAVVTDPVTYTVTAKNSAGDTTPNVVISYTITGANPASGTLVATDNSGISSLTYTAANAGTDTVTFFVNQTTGATAGADANEPKVTATTTVAAAPSGNTIDLTCTGALNTSPEDCVDPTTHNTQVFSAFVSKGFDASSNPIPAAGILVRFTVSSTNAPSGATLSPTSAVTNAKGVATTTLTDTKNTNGTADTVTATIAGQTTPQAGGVNSDSGTKTFQTAAPSTVTVTPALNTTQTGTASTFVATVKDQFSQPVSGSNVDFYIGSAASHNTGGRNSSLNGLALLNKTTNASGQATLSYTDVGPSNNVVGPNAADVITAVVDSNGNDVKDAGELAGTATNNFITEPATAGSVDLDVTGSGTCGVTTTEPTNDSQSYPPDTTTHSVCALVKTAGGAPLTGKTVTFTLSGVGFFAKADGTALTSPQTATTDPNGVATILVVSTKSGAQNISGAIDGKSDAGTITYTSPTLAQSRFIDLKPDTSNITPGANVELTALVTDRFGNPVSGVPVAFSETGPGSFSNGTSSATGTTGATGTVTVTLTSAAGSTGTETVTAAIDTSNFAVLFSGTQCDDAANNPVAGTPAGKCSDASTYTFKSATAPTITVSPTALNVGQLATVVVHGTPGDAVQLLAYSRPSTTYAVVRNGTIGSTGTVTFQVGPRTNTRLFAKTAGGSSTSAAISVRPAESLFGTATGKTGSFHGGIVPGHAGVTVRIFTVKNGQLSAKPVGTATTDANGKWTFSRTFAATGPVTFISQTLSDLTNLAGQSNRITITFK